MITDTSFQDITKDDALLEFQQTLSSFSLCSVARRKFFIISSNPFSILSVRMSRKGEAKSKTKIDKNYCLKDISCCYFIDCISSKNSFTKKINRRLFCGLFGLNSLLVEDQRILFGTASGGIYSVSIPSGRTSEPSVNCIYQGNQSIQCILFNSQENGQSIIVSVGCDGEIIVITDNGIDEFPCFIVQSYSLQCSITNAILSNDCTLIYLSNNKLFFVDLIENNNLASILIPFSPSTLDIPFSNIGNCIESSKWISIDKNGIVYRFSYELASNLREQSIDFLSKSQQNEKMKNILTKLSLLSDSQNKQLEKEKYLNKLMEECGILSKILHSTKYQIANCSIHILSPHPTITEVSNEKTQFIIQLKYTAQESFISNHWKLLIHFKSSNYNTSVSVPLSENWVTCKTYGFSICSPFTIDDSSFPISVMITLLYSPLPLKTISIPLTSRIFSVLDFHHLYSNSSKSMIKSRMVHPYHQKLSEYTLNSINLKISAPISTSLTSIDLIQHLIHSENKPSISGNELNCQLVSPLNVINLKIDRILNNDINIPELMINIETSPLDCIQVNMSLIITVLSLYSTLSTEFKSNISNGNIKEEHINLLEQEIQQNLSTISLGKYSDELIQLQSDIYKFISTYFGQNSYFKPKELSISFYELQNRILNIYQTMRQEINPKIVY